MHQSPWLPLAILALTAFPLAAAERAKPANDQRLLLTHTAWQGVPTTALSVAEFDKLVTAERGGAPAALLNDEQFLRRVTLDLTGRPPTAADLRAFLTNDSANKRATVVDKLLKSKGYADHWAHYWHDVIMARVTGPQEKALATYFESWLEEQFASNRPWNSLVKEMLTATGSVRFDRGIMPAGKPGAMPRTPPKPTGNPAAFFLLAFNGADAINERTGETARVFLGLQLSCAQCHDHPFDSWKREQFHELAGYFGRLDDRRYPPALGFGLELTSRKFREHEMPSKDDPNKGTVMHPKFLTGQSAPRDLSDADRRAALAEQVAGPDNYWFAAAYVNRVWTRLFGQGFYDTVDDIGPERQVRMPQTLARLATHFKATGYDTHALFRLIVTSQTYQRHARAAAPAGGKVDVAGNIPTKLRPDVVWNSLVNVIGDPTPALARMLPMGLRRGPQTFERQVLAEFDFDPSLKHDETEGTIPQALLLMNNPQINAKLTATGSNLLAVLLKEHHSDGDAVKALYQKVLARSPSDREMMKAQTYIGKSNKRADAYEDLLWVLINSTEFQTKR